MKILYFDTNKTCYTPGETVTFFWEVENTEIVELRPYGRVEAKGIKTIQISKNTSGVLTFTLIANPLSSNNVEKQIRLSEKKPSWNSSDKEKDGDSLFSTIIQYIVIGFVGIGLCLFAYTHITGNSINIFKNNQTIDVPKNDEQIQSARPTVANCDFTSAYQKAEVKISALLLAKVDDDGLGEENNNDCTVTYKFFVKQKGYDIDGKEYTEDKIKHLFLTYKKIGNSFEFISGKLFTGVSETQYQSIE